MDKQLRINNILYRENELLIKCKSVINNSSLEWEKDIYIFIEEWINDSEEIVAHTSGSTGKPKQIHISKLAMQESAKATGIALNLKKDDRALLCLSAKYIAGKMMIVRGFTLGLNIFFREVNSHPLQSANEYFDFAAMIPLQVVNCLEYLKIDIVNKLIIGGARIDDSLEELLVQKSTNIYATFGMTETLSHIALREIKAENAEKIFTAINNVSFDTDKRNCLRIKAPKINKNIIKTNDIIKLINHNQFIWLARYDNVINSGGLKFFPELMEIKIAHLLEHSFFIAGIKDKILGQKICLFIENENFDYSQKTEFLNKINTALDQYEAIRMIFIIDIFHKTENNKINRKKTIQNIKIK